MRVELVKQSFDCFGYPDCGFKYMPFEYCCDKLKNNPLIDLISDEYDYSEVPSFNIVHKETINDWEDTYENETFYRIDYCPFCGEQFDIRVVGEEDVSEVIAKLDKEREAVWKKYCRSNNSYKKKEEINKSLRELDDKINHFHNLAEYDESWKGW